MGVAGCNGGSAMFGMTVDDSGDLYVLYRCAMERYAPANSLAVYESAPNVNGNVSPIRTFTTPGWEFTTPVPVSPWTQPEPPMSAQATRLGNSPSCRRSSSFPPLLPGTVTPTYILTSSAWNLITPPAGADDWFDPVRLDRCALEVSFT